jgi:hypothetical protein
LPIGGCQECKLLHKVLLPAALSRFLASGRRKMAYACKQDMKIEAQSSPNRL